MRLGITTAQRRQIDRLTVQLGIKTIRGRNRYVSEEVGREIEHLVELSTKEAAAVVEVLKVELAARKDIQKQEAAVAVEVARELCMACAGTGRTCAVCARPVQRCVDEGGGGHFYDPVVCTACGGERFE